MPQQEEPGYQEDAARGPLRSVIKPRKGSVWRRSGEQALCPMEVGQGGTDRVCCERLRLDTRKDLALRSSRFSFRMSWSGLGSSGV